MKIKTIPKYGKINIIDERKKCINGEKHNLKLTRVNIYNKNKTYSEESVFQCNYCQKIFIVKGNKERFESNYPLYEIDYEKEEINKSQNNLSKENNIKKNKPKKKSKIQRAIERNEQIKLEKQRKLKNATPDELRKMKIKELIDGNRIVVLSGQHRHKFRIVKCSIGKLSINLKYCDECNLLYCTEEQYDDFIKLKINKSKFIYNNVEHVDLSLFNRKPNKYIDYDNNLRKPKKEINETKQEIKNITHNENGKTLIVKTDNRGCIFNNHTVKNVSVSIDLLKNNGEIITHVIPAFKCEECNIIFIYDYQFYELVKIGQPLCLIIDQTIYLKIIKDNRFNLCTDSLLTLYGYNVNQNENLKTKQRHNILKMLINSKLIRIDVAISHLRGLVKQRQNRKNHKNAIARWNEDIDFLTTYEMNLSDNYSIETIINKSRQNINKKTKK